MDPRLLDLADGLYVYNAGYWGPHIGFYGGIVYGFGYTGLGYEGGYWHNGAFFYNRTVNNVTNVNIINVYDKTVIINANALKVSYNGGKGGVTAAPTSEQLASAREIHRQATASQLIQQQAAHKNPQAFARMNNGKPPATLLVAPQHLIPKANVPAMLQAQKSHQQLQIQSPKPMVSALKPRPQPKVVTQQTRRVRLVELHDMPV